MSLKERNKKLIKLYCEGMKYSDIGRLFKLSLERVRQIVNPSLKLYCKKHRRRYEKHCEICSIEKEYPAKVEKNVDKEIKKLPDSRDQFTVEKRRIITIYLKDRKNLSFSQVAKVLGRDISTINYLYYGKPSWQKYNEQKNKAK